MVKKLIRLALLFPQIRVTRSPVTRSHATRECGVVGRSGGAGSKNSGGSGAGGSGNSAAAGGAGAGAAARCRSGVIVLGVKTRD